MSQRIAVAQADSAFGVSGALKVRPFAGRDSVLPSQSFCWLGFEDPATHKRFAISKAAWHRASLLLFLEPLIVREQFSLWRGASVFLERAQFPKTQKNEYYQSDLLGFSVINQDGIVLGVIDTFLDMPANAVMVVKETTDDGTAEHLLPFIKHVITEVSLDEAKVLVDWSLE